MRELRIPTRNTNPIHNDVLENTTFTTNKRNKKSELIKVFKTHLNKNILKW